jgi:zinc protease
MENPQDKIYFFWTCEMDFDLRTSLIAKITGQIFNNIFREEIREKRGWTYHVDTHCSVVPDHNGTDRPVVYFPLNVTLKEGTARECRDLINGVMNDVAQHGLPEDRLATVKQYLKKVHAEDVADNSYWMVMLKNLDKFGINFDRNYLETLDAITVADIQRFVQQLLAGSRLELQMTPEK